MGNNNSYYLVPGSDLNAIGDAIREKSDNTINLEVKNMASAIKAIPQEMTNLEELTNPASGSDVLSGKQAYNDNGELINGTMPFSNVTYDPHFVSWDSDSVSIGSYIYCPSGYLENDFESAPTTDWNVYNGDRIIDYDISASRQNPVVLTKTIQSGQWISWSYTFTDYVYTSLPNMIPKAGYDFLWIARQKQTMSGYTIPTSVYVWTEYGSAPGYPQKVSCTITPKITSGDTRIYLISIPALPEEYYNFTAEVNVVTTNVS